MIWLLPLSILIIFELLADIFAKQWSLNTHSWFWIAALLCYMLGNVSWLIALKNGSGLGRGAVFFSVASALLAVLIGVLVYNEKVSAMQAFGMVLGIVAIGLIYWE